MTLAEELQYGPGRVVADRLQVRVVTCRSVRLPFDGTLSPDERRLLEQFAFATECELREAA